MVSQPVFAGIDVGASRTKVALLDKGKNLIGHAVRNSGTDFRLASETCLDTSAEMAKVDRKDIVRTISTGYGRKNVTYSDDDKTEIACHSKGCYHYFPKSITIKIIK
jgi:activator of 2-hydroxyglutaryl-CoA dehydratase